MTTTTTTKQPNKTNKQKRQNQGNNRKKNKHKIQNVQHFSKEDKRLPLLSAKKPLHMQGRKPRSFKVSGIEEIPGIIN